MFNALITTLTPVHVGSGRTLQKHIDYVHFSNIKNGPIALIDEEKVLAILGRDNLGKWMETIENKKDLLTLINKHESSLQPNKLARRLIKARDNPGLHNELYEQLTDGMGRPYIPGSSIKGSIRTALFTYMLRQNPSFLEKLNPSKFIDDELMIALMATPERSEVSNFKQETSNKDIFRFLRVGDIHFTSTQSIMVKAVNLKRTGWAEDNRLSQWTECIPENQEARSRIDFADDTLLTTAKSQKIQKEQTETVGKGVDLLRKKELLQIVNNHTTHLLQRELNFIKQQNDSNLEQYAEQIETLLAQTKQCGPEECVIRLGKHSGFLFMTGDWQRELMKESDYILLKNHVRRKQHTPANLPLPKTRRFTKAGMPLGFVKITIKQSL